MANRYWVSGGSSANWTATGNTNWGTASNTRDNASVPSSADAVIFDNSANGNSACTINAAATCASITFAGDGAGAYANTLTHNNSISLTASGSITFVAGMTYTSQTGSILQMNGTGTLTTAGLTLPRITIPSGGAMTLGDNLITKGFSLTKSGTGTFDANGKTVTLSGVGSKTIDGTFTFYNLTRSSTGDPGDIFSLATNITVTNNLTIAGQSVVNRMFVISSALGTQRTITNTGATMTWSNLDFRDIAISTAYDASGVTGGCGNGLGNSGITFTTLVTRYWVDTNGGNWSDTTSWSASSGGASGVTAPLVHDTVIIDVNSITVGASTINANIPRLGADIDFTGVLNSPTLSVTGANIYGSLTLESGMTVSGVLGITMFSRSAETLTTNGATITQNLNISMFGGTLTLADAYTSTSGISFTTGTLDNTTNNVTVTISGITALGSITVNAGSATWFITSTGTAWNWVSGTYNTGTSTIKFTNTTNTAITFAGGSKTYNNVWFSRGASTAANTITGSNTYADFKSDGSAAHSFLWTAGTTNTFTTFTVSGSSGNAITINSAAGLTTTHALVKAGGGTISSDWLNIQHSVATPASTWYAGANSVDNQATATAGSGWIFTVPPSGSSIKTINGLAYASVKTVNGLAIASVKTVNGLA